LQSEWQKKSAGSFLLGGNIVYGNITADSAFVPSVLANTYPQKDVRTLRYVQVGPGAGYSYTYVLKEHWYLSASTAVNLDFGFVKETTSAYSKNTNSLSPKLILRIGTGYNSSNWNLNISWISNRNAIEGQYRNGGYNVNTGTYRFSVGRRFTPGKKVKKLLKVIDNILD
jgi:hypothetical protein